MSLYSIEVKRLDPHPSGHDRETLTFLYTADMSEAEAASVIAAVSSALSDITWNRERENDCD